MTEPPICIAGIDPGTRAMGFGVLRVDDRSARFVSAGVLETRVGDPIPARLGQLRRALDRLFADYSPQVVVVEEAFAHQNIQSALRIGEARGVVLACADTFGAQLVQMPPAVAKKTLVGNGGASKEQVAGMVTRLLGLNATPEPLDATDALSLALAHVMRGRSLTSGASSSANGLLSRSKKASPSRASQALAAATKAHNQGRQGQQGRLLSFSSPAKGNTPTNRATNNGGSTS